MLWDWQTLRLAGAPKLIACHAVWLEEKKGTDGRKNEWLQTKPDSSGKTDGRTNKKETEAEEGFI